MNLFKRKSAEPEIVPELAIVWWQYDDDVPRYIGYPVKVDGWERYVVEPDGERFVVRWQMHGMNAIIGWTRNDESARLFAEDHHAEESAYAHRI